MPTEEEVVRVASEAAEDVVFSRYTRSEITDLDVTIRFEDGILDIDIYLNAPADPDPDEVAEDAVRAAEAAVDACFADDE